VATAATDQVLVTTRPKALLKGSQESTQRSLRFSVKLLVSHFQEIVVIFLCARCVWWRSPPIIQRTKITDRLHSLCMSPGDPCSVVLKQKLAKTSEVYGD